MNPVNGLSFDFGYYNNRLIEAMRASNLTTNYRRSMRHVSFEFYCAISVALHKRYGDPLGADVVVAVTKAKLSA